MSKNKTQCWATFGAYGRPDEGTLGILKLAQKFRQELCELHHAEHVETIEFRNLNFPELYEALRNCEATSYHIYLIEREIKQHHSQRRDRDAVPASLRTQLREARERLAGFREQRRAGFQAYSRFLKTYSAARTAEANWKDVKSQAKREELYRTLNWGKALAAARKQLLGQVGSTDPKLSEAAQNRLAALDWDVDPDQLARYATIKFDWDLKRRTLKRRYQDEGLHSDIRAEICEASEPKRGKNGPGMRYRYYEPPSPRPWRKLTMQFKCGGLPLKDAIAGKNKAFSLTHCHDNLWQVFQQIGTRDWPQSLTYMMKIEKPFPAETLLKRWSLVIDSRQHLSPAGVEQGLDPMTLYKMQVVPTVSNVDFSKPTGQGVLQYELTWTPLEALGIRVARFWSEHVCESLVIPWWLVQARCAVELVQVETDLKANAFLESVNYEHENRQGVAALQACLEDSAILLRVTDRKRGKLLHRRCLQRWFRARRTQTRAIRCIEAIYKTVAARMRRLHDEAVHPKLDLTKVKRYDTRDLLQPSLPKELRGVLFNASPGKLRSYLQQSLPAAVGATTTAFPATASKTDVFTSYVYSLGQSQPQRKGKPGPYTKALVSGRRKRS